MEYNRNSVRADTATIHYYASCSEETSRTSCQHYAKRAIPVEHSVFSNKNLSYTPLDFVNNHAQFQNGLTNSKMSYASENVQGTSCCDKRETVNEVGSETFRNRNYSDEGNLQPYFPTLELSQVGCGYSSFMRKCISGTGGKKTYLTEERTALYKGNNMNTSGKYRIGL